MLAASRLTSLITHRTLLSSCFKRRQTTAGAASANVRRPFLLYTGGTPNGRKVSVYLEELRDAYGVDYEWVFIYTKNLLSSEGIFFWGGVLGR
ncbi:hypothetical protein M413DRAFT_444170 [Hebeloma cylindrosporum]|uniref:GST N-terminal domain-containing protein n=1 Tax=Hebeloma cylindrosporum TaxID=76867 RepID=A0A0C3CGQ2_HEBCY|nr:hypothetical protein M413DRAFT_444170 [Hebeloma cylindrosporum h7]